jgi:glycosyltransferase involved in cell wall biosynthesis
MILFISDFDLKGSGYMNIAVSLCNELATRHGFDVTALGIGYDMSEHNWPFSILPVEQSGMMGKIPAMLHNFKAMAEQNVWKPVEAVIVALDIPLHELLLQMDLQTPRGPIPYVGILPIESGPLCASWASTLAIMTDRMIISEFGTKMVTDTGLDAVYLPVGIDPASWRPPGKEERKSIRESLGFTDDDFVVLTVADNQERKNLSAAMEIMSKTRKKINAKWMLVTRLQSPVGWKLNDLAANFDMTDHFVGFDRGLPFDRLWILYAAADAFLLTSKAEGLCLPVLEAMATETPVLALDTTAIPEHIYEEPDWDRVDSGLWGKGNPRKPRGFPIPVEYSIIDPWGNSVRSFPNSTEAAKRLVALSKMNPKDLKKITDRGREYAENRSWATAGNAVADVLRNVIAPKPVGDDPSVGLPASAPRPIPPMYGIPDSGGIE